MSFGGPLFLTVVKQIEFIILNAFFHDSVDRIQVFLYPPLPKIPSFPTPPASQHTPNKDAIVTVTDSGELKSN